MFGIEQAGDQFEIRTTVAESIRRLQHLETGGPIRIPLESVLVKLIDVGSVELEIEFAPIVFLGYITRSKIDPVRQSVSHVQVVGDDFLNEAGTIPDNCSGESVRSANQRLGRNGRNLIAKIDLVPVDVRAKSLGPTPPAVVVPGGRGPDGLQIVTIRIFRLQVSIATILQKDIVGLAILGIGNWGLELDRRPKKLTQCRCDKTFGVGTPKSQIIERFVPYREFRLSRIAEIAVVVVPLREYQIEIS